MLQSCRYSPVLHRKNIPVKSKVKSKAKSCSAEQVPRASRRQSIPGCFAWLENSSWSLSAVQWWGFEACDCSRSWSGAAAGRWVSTFSFGGEAARWGGAGERLSRRARGWKRPWTELEPRKNVDKEDEKPCKSWSDGPEMMRFAYLHVHAQCSKDQENGRMDNIHKHAGVKKAWHWFVKPFVWTGSPKSKSYAEFWISLVVSISSHYAERGHGQGQDKVWYLLQLKVPEESHIPVHILDVRVQQREGSHAPEGRWTIFIWNAVTFALRQGQEGRVDLLRGGGRGAKSPVPIILESTKGEGDYCAPKEGGEDETGDDPDVMEDFTVAFRCGAVYPDLGNGIQGWEIE